MINTFPQLAMKNKNSLSFCTKVGCFHCMKIYEKQEIKEYTDNNETAICPYCQVDSVIGDSLGFPLNQQILERANKFWFQPRN